MQQNAWDKGIHKRKLQVTTLYKNRNTSENRYTVYWNIYKQVNLLHEPLYYV